MTENVPRPITPEPNRLKAATIVAELTGMSLLTAGLVVDLVDIDTAAKLGYLGLDPLEVRRTAVAIWTGRGLEATEAGL